MTMNAGGATHALSNISPGEGQRSKADDNAFGLAGMDHFALPTRNIELMERFIRDVLGGEPYYYAGFDATDREMGRMKHIFIRVGRVLMQCAEPKNGEMIIRKDDPNGLPHFAFAVSAQDLDKNCARLRRLGIPVAGPFRHRGIDVVSAYFQSPEGHKLEICTWQRYDGDAATIGMPGVGGVPWAELAHDWPNGK
jgi:catechol 2,3-dioxygenase-like lactoylglutathione lyase family enzyme